MRKRLSLFAVLAFVVCALGAFAESPALDPGRVVTQGEFAVLYARAITAKEPEAGFTPDEAIALLNSLSDPIAPEEGWKPDQPLTERVMVGLVKHVGVFISPTDPDALVTVALANLVFRRYDRRFENYILYRLQASNSTDATVLEEGDITGHIPLSAFCP